MITLNQGWWEQLAPKDMFRRRKEFEALLSKWCRSEYGQFWMHSARRPNSVVRAKVGQFIPTVHVIAVGEAPAFIAPQPIIKPGHRVVSTSLDQYVSGNALEADELAFQPLLMFDVVQDQGLIAALHLSNTLSSLNEIVNTRRITKPSLVFSAPAWLLLEPTYAPKKSFVIYQHIFGDSSSYPHDGYFYVGVTTRSWRDRWNEHRRAVESGSPLLFHRKFREEMEAGRITYIHHKVMGITDNLDALYDAEEDLVAGHWHDKRRLNMIPGGKSGLKYLREHGLLPPRTVPLPDERDKVLADWIRAHPKKGLPAPWVSEMWKNDDWAVAQICNRDDRLSQEQVRAIRNLSASNSAEIIADKIGARNVDQVRRVLDGRTYTRVK